MPSKGDRTGRRAELHSAIRALHDELKSLALTCAPEFPKEATGGLEFLDDILCVQGIVGNYERALLARLFQSTGRSTEASSSILRNSGKFTRLWNQRRKLRKQENRSEIEIDAAIRRQVSFMLAEMLLLGEEELRGLDDPEDIPEMLYYSSTVKGSLLWYAGRYLARLDGELAKMEDLADQ